MTDYNLFHVNVINNAIYIIYSVKILKYQIIIVINIYSDINRDIKLIENIRAHIYT